MGIFKKLFHRDMTPEELEEKSRREKELAEKYYNKGVEMREKLGIERKVEGINRFANKYPITFFAILFAFVIGSCVINFIASSSGSFWNDTAEEIRDIPQIEQTFDDETKKLRRDILGMYEEMETIGKEIETYLKKDTLTHQDSLKIKEKLIRFQTLADFLENNKNLENETGTNHSEN